MKRSDTVSRRRILEAAAIGTAGLSPLLAAAARAGRSPYGPFKMGIQSYSLRGFNLDQALAHTKELGLRYWESYNAHIPLTTDSGRIAEFKQKLAAAGVQVLAYGVVGFAGDAAKNRAVFEGAKALGIRTLSADPTPQSLDQLEQLVEEFKINIAIHNHGPGHRYDRLQQVVDAVKGRHRRIGACVDTGHFLRSRENPVQVIETLGERVHGVHLKDVKDAKTFTILGKGDLDLVGTLKALQRLKFHEVMALEYEENPKDPIADIRECLAAVRAAADRL